MLEEKEAVEEQDETEALLDRDRLHAAFCVPAIDVSRGRGGRRGRLAEFDADGEPDADEDDS